MALDTEIPVVEEEVPQRASRPARDDEAWADLLGRISRLSVSRHFDAYGDVDWESDELRLDPEDARWEVGELEPLGSTEWYRSLPPSTRARIGCEMVATRMKLGLE